MSTFLRATLSVLVTFSITTLSAATIGQAQERTRITIGTGGSAGVYFVVGNAICRMVRLNARKDRSTRINCAAPPSGGSIDNLEQLRAGKIQFAIVQSDWQFHAYNGSSIFEDDRHENIRSLFSIHVEPFQIVARKGADIRSWDDLTGKRVNIGNVGSGQRATFEELIRAHDQDLSSFAAVSELESSLQASALCNNDIDAFAFTVGVPNASIAQATDGCDGTIIDVNTPIIRDLVERAPYYRWTTIPEGTYFTTTKNVRTLGVLATLVTNSEVSDDVVYAIVKSVHENIDLFTVLHPAFSDMNSKDMANVGLSAPLHPGAIRAYRELGILE